MHIICAYSSISCAQLTNRAHTGGYILAYILLCTSLAFELSNFYISLVKKHTSFRTKVEQVLVEPDKLKLHVPVDL